MLAEQRAHEHRVDPELRARLWDHLRTIADGGTTVILTTHYIDEAAQADAVGLMRNGRLLAEDAVARTGVPRERIDIIENPHLAVGGGPAALPLAPHYILGIGRLEPQKAWDLAIRAYAQADTGDRPLIIYGEGSERAKLTALIERLGLTGRVFLSQYDAWCALKTAAPEGADEKRVAAQ